MVGLVERRILALISALLVSGAVPVCIDEYQHVPDLFDASNTELNRDARPGRFVLTGSTRCSSRMPPR